MADITNLQWWFWGGELGYSDQALALGVLWEMLGRVESSGPSFLSKVFRLRPGVAICIFWGDVRISGLCNKRDKILMFCIVHLQQLMDILKKGSV